MALSRPVVEAYWLGYAQKGSGLSLDQIPANTPVDVVKIAFYNLYPANSVSVCFGMSQISWGDTAAGIQALQAAGTKVMASLIGTPDPPVDWGGISDARAFAANAKALLVDALGCDGIDLDMDGGPPPTSFQDVVNALRDELGAKGGEKSLLTAVMYQPDFDLPWLKAVGDQLDWVSTMAYWEDVQGQQALWKQYADVIGGENVLVGVGTGQQSTTLATVEGVAKWQAGLGAGKAGGMMLWNLNTGPYQQYYDAIKQNLTTWKPPGT
ncbi:MAG: glycosyl hydrolase family 18 protein [Actinomycetota bacterium]|nr:glycosyl hydrolase family 18 protein [Actinomycetota bacterium]